MYGFTPKRAGFRKLEFAFSGTDSNIGKMGGWEEKKFACKSFDGLLVRVTVALTAAADARVWLLAEAAGKISESADQAMLFQHDPAWSPAGSSAPTWHYTLPTSGTVASRIQTSLCVPFPRAEYRLRCACDAAGDWTVEGTAVLLRGVFGEDAAC